MELTSAHRGKEKTNLLDSDAIAGRLEFEKRDHVLSREPIEDLRRGLLFLSPSSVMDFYRDAHKQCAPERKAEIKTVTDSTTAQIKGAWPQEKLRLAPGAAILERAIDRLGATFSKDRGDSEVLAALINPSNISPEIRSLIEEVSAADLERSFDENAAVSVEA